MKNTPTNADGVAPVEILELRERIVQLQERWDKRERTRLFAKVQHRIAQAALRDLGIIKRACIKARMPNPPDLRDDWAVIEAKKWDRICRVVGLR